MREFLADLKLNPSQEILNRAFGMPGKVISPDSNFAEGENSWQEVKTLTRAEKLARITKWSENESEDLVKMFEMFSRVEILSLKQEPKNFRNVNLLLQAAGALKKNFNKKLVLQTLFLNL
jgi:3-methyladenine DNA glycosylase AlkC